MTFKTAIALSGLLLFTACRKDGPTEDFDEAGGLLGDGIGQPFPNAHMVGDDGYLALSPDLFPAGPSPFPADLANYRTGFSPIQVSTLSLPDISCNDCPNWKKNTLGEGSVKLVDLTDGVFLPVMAELDAFKPGEDDPPVPPGEPKTLIVRPQVAIPYDHQVAVVVTTAAMARPERFDGLIGGLYDTPWSDHYRGVVDQVVGLGVKESEIALVWDFPVADGTQPTRSAVAQSSPPGTWRATLNKEADLGDATPDSIWRQVQGTYDVVNFVDDEGQLDLDVGTGDVAVLGTDTANFSVAIPHSVKDAPAGTVPVVIYGHGLLSSANADIYGRDGDWAVFDIASDIGAIVIATDWGGLDANDYLVSISVANDLGKFPNLAGKMVQGQANHQALLELIRSGAFDDDPLFQGTTGQSLIDGDQILYWGVSMGGILGGVAMAQEPAGYQAGVFHVGGSSWSNLLERSSAWTTFEMFVFDAVPSPADRQHLYAASQLFWDPVDPVAYADDLKDKTILLQESTNDDTVHNMTTRILARSIELPVLEPSVDSSYGLETAQADLPAGSRAFVQFDSGASAPKNVNRPADGNGAHVRTLGWWETWTQAADFLTPGAEGQVIHYCGGAACSSSNRGQQ